MSAMSHVKVSQGTAKLYAGYDLLAYVWPSSYLLSVVACLTKFYFYLKAQQCMSHLYQ